MSTPKGASTPARMVPNLVKFGSISQLFEKTASHRAEVGEDFVHESILGTRFRGRVERVVAAASSAGPAGARGRRRRELRVPRDVKMTTSRISDEFLATKI